MHPYTYMSQANCREKFASCIYNLVRRYIQRICNVWFILVKTEPVSLLFANRLIEKSNSGLKSIICAQYIYLYVLIPVPTRTLI